jgi:hypothetical protein
MPRLTVGPIVICLVLISAASATAQDRLFVGAAELGAFGRFGERIGDAPAAVYGEFAAGGRYVVSGAVAYDTRSGQAIALRGGAVVGLDARLPRVFVHDGTTLSIFDLDSRVVTPILAVPAHDPTAPPVAMARVAHDSQELFVLRTLPSSTFVGGPETPAVFVVVDLATHAVTRTFTVMPPGVVPRVDEWRPTADGRRVVVNSINHLSLVDGVSGVVLAQQALGFGAGGNGRILDDREAARYYLHEYGRVTVVDDHLTWIAQRSLYNGPGGTAGLAFSPHTRRIYIREARGGGTGGSNGNISPPEPLVVTLTVLDADTGRLVHSRDVTQATAIGGACGLCAVAVVTAPGAPARVTASVSGRDVTLAWTNAGDASAFVLDVGLAPGRTDLTFGIGGSSPVTLANAPPGTYYVRVRGTNAFGVSRPSSEVTIVVP